MMKIQIMNLHDLECIKPIISEFDDFWSVNILDQNFNNSNSIYFIAKAESSDDFTSQTSQEADNILGFIALLDTPIDIEISNIVVRKRYRNLGASRCAHFQTAWQVPISPVGEGPKRNPPSKLLAFLVG